MKDEDTKGNAPTGRPIISSRLPKAFSQPKHLTTKKSHDHQDLSQVSEFKKVKKLLSPLKNVNQKSSAFRQAINKLSKFPQIQETTPFVYNEFLTQSVVRLEEMITLSVLKSSCSSGTVRKVLHAPSFQIYASKEISINTVATRKNVLDTLKAWQNVQSSARYLVEINSSFWNTPEGCVTLIMEYLPGDSLSKLCDTVGALPERLLRSISKRILAGLSFYHKRVGPHGNISMNHILFDRHGKCKLGIGINLKDKNQEKSIKDDIYSFGCTLLAAALGSAEWISDLPVHGCCLFHAALNSAEIPYLLRFSLKFQEFLCKASSFEAKIDTNGLLAHSWINDNESEGADVSLQELLSLTVAGSKDFSFNNESGLSIFLENVQVVLSGRSELKSVPDSVIKEVAMEIGVRSEILQEKVKKIFISG